MLILWFASLKKVALPEKLGRQLLLEVSRSGCKVVKTPLALTSNFQINTPHAHSPILIHCDAIHPEWEERHQ
jgi:hypothetical protein